MLILFVGQTDFPRFSQCPSVCEYFKLKRALVALNLMGFDDLPFRGMTAGNESTTVCLFRQTIYSGTAETQRKSKSIVCQKILHRLITDGDPNLAHLPIFKTSKKIESVLDYLAFIATHVYELKTKPHPVGPKNVGGPTLSKKNVSCRFSTKVFILYFPNLF